MPKADQDCVAPGSKSARAPATTSHQRATECDHSSSSSARSVLPPLFSPSVRTASLLNERPAQNVASQASPSLSCVSSSSNRKDRLNGSSSIECAGAPTGASVSWACATAANASNRLPAAKRALMFPLRMCMGVALIGGTLRTTRNSDDAEHSGLHVVEQMAVERPRPRRVRGHTERAFGAGGHRDRVLANLELTGLVLEIAPQDR